MQRLARASEPGADCRVVRCGQPFLRVYRMEEGRSWIQRHYNLQQTSSQYAELYRELLAERAAPARRPA